MRGHDHWLKWDAGDYTKGTEPEMSPSVRFRVSPTYIYNNPLDNFIAGSELVSEILEGKSGKAETKRLGYENSEDALSWNVFRSLQEAGKLRIAMSVLAGVESRGEPDLLLWGRRVSLEKAGEASKLQRILDELEPALKQQTEPDIILHLKGWGWLFIEAKLTSPTPTYARKPHRLNDWINRYANTCPDLFDSGALKKADAKTFPEQLLRNVAVARLMCDAGEQAYVVALVRRGKDSKIEERVQAYLSDKSAVGIGRATWEDIFDALPSGGELETLRRYLENKSVGLRRAFHLESGEAPKQ